MTEPENFLPRWSRLKREVDAVAPEPTDQPQDVAQPEPRVEESPAPAATQDPTEKLFDPASLPSIESIGAGTDIRAFLAPGVPSELRHAALRRAWSADPAIRDFVGLAEYAWDFTAPDAMAGFGPLEMTDELRSLARRIVGGLGSEPVVEEAENQVVSIQETPGAGPHTQEALPARAATATDMLSPEPDLLQCKANDIAPQTGTDEVNNPALPPTRKGGSALPQ
jgi:hypothetical protein